MLEELKNENVKFKKMSEEEKQLIDYTLQSTDISRYKVWEEDDKIFVFGLGEHNIDEAKKALSKLGQNVKISRTRQAGGKKSGYIIIDK